MLLVAGLLAEPEYAGLSDAEAAVALTTRPVLTRDVTVPVSLTHAGLLSLISPANLAKIPDTTLDSISALVKAQDREALARWAQVQLLKGNVSSDEVDAVNAYLAATSTVQESYLGDSPLAVALGRPAGGLAASEVAAVRAMQ
jgi:hypothetical protein